MNPIYKCLEEKCQMQFTKPEALAIHRVNLCLISGMAAMQFPCNGIVLIQGNLPRVTLEYTLNYASFLIHYFNVLFSLIGNGQICDLTLLECNFLY